MAEAPLVQTFPIAPRVQGNDGRPTPHIGPTLEHYKELHAKTIHPDSDEWWAKVH